MCRATLCLAAPFSGLACSPERFTVDRVWGVQRDELDRASVAWIELPGGTSAEPRRP